MAVSEARQYHTQQVHYLRRTVTFANNGAVLEVGTIPAGSLILRPASGVHVITAFNAGSSNVLDIGTTATADLFGTDLALGSVGFVAVDENVAGFRTSAATAITASVVLGGTAATAGEGEVVICYIPDNDL
jgi:hypothetical protein